MKSIHFRIPILSICCLIFFLSCSEEIFVDPIDAELFEYFENFKIEGEKRGVTVDYEAAGIEGHLENITDAGVAGKCIKYVNGYKEVSIDAFYWNRYSPLEKEFLIFHELGHCFLERDHLDTADSHGYCISIMHSSDQVCINNYYPNTRDAYLDELFQ